MSNYVTREEAYERVSNAFPKPTGETFKGKRSAQTFTSCDDHTQLIENVLSIISHNGSYPFKNCHYKLVFSMGRRDGTECVDSNEEEDNPSMFATLVETNAQGVIVAKLGPAANAYSREEALDRFKDMIQRKIHRLLGDVPRMEAREDAKMHEISQGGFSEDDEPPLKRGRAIAERAGDVRAVDKANAFGWLN